MRLGIITGLADEAACLAASPDVSIVCAGPGPTRAAEAARAAIAQGAKVLVSFGVAGSLVPAVRPGQLVLPETVMADGRRFATWPLLRQELASALSVLHQGLLVGSDTPIASPAAKRALSERTGAILVDMESHAVALLAASAGLPFVVLRAVIDGADEAVPEVALAGMGEDGRSRTWPVVRGVMQRPWQLPQLVRLGLRMQAALAALRRAAPVLVEVGRRV